MNNQDEQRVDGGFLFQYNRVNFKNKFVIQISRRSTHSSDVADRYLSQSDQIEPKV